ncbi:hypothetical protein N7493_001217 [Penicillium malachiteum]|uniref:Uncharacterized protein n=1 Tax=Penicillium malachiteum TaxID=1324776 RepID=A0AAD6MZN0_9EURO|nr:hypothetical protein N7493_001217 [Penicillium malachiteum]
MHLEAVFLFVGYLMVGDLVAGAPVKPSTADPVSALGGYINLFSAYDAGKHGNPDADPESALGDYTIFSAYKDIKRSEPEVEGMEAEEGTGADADV